MHRQFARVPRNGRRSWIANSVRNVIFDLGGVVFRWDPQRIVRSFYADDTLHQPILTEVFQHPDWIELDRGTLDEPDAIHRFRMRTGRSAEEMQALMHATRESLLPITETIDLINELAEQGVPLYCLSNAATRTFDFLRERHDVFAHFRGVVISGAIKLIKPDPKIFHHISERYDLAPGDTIFVDDNLPNIESAARLGFHTVHFRDSRQCRTELMPLLNR